MSNVAMRARDLIGNFAFFLEAGTTVDGVIVAAETVADPLAGKPDANPLGNWPDLGAVEMCKWMPKLKEELFDVPQVDGFYQEEEESRVIADILQIRTNHASEFYHRLRMGFPAVVVSGTAQTAHSNKSRKITGWLRVQSRVATVNRSILDWWCEMRVVEFPDETNATIRPTYQFRKLYSTLNDGVINAG